MSNWNEERTQLLTNAAGDVNSEISQERVKEIAVDLDISARSVGSKLRKMGFTVQKAVDVARTNWPENVTSELRALLERQPGELTFAEVAQVFQGGTYSTKAVQGKILSMEMTGSVKPTPKAEAVRSYSEEEQATFIEMAGRGASIEAIADALNKTIPSVRGKALSLSKTEGFVMPAQAKSHAKTKVDPIDDLGNSLKDLTVSEVAKKVGKSERGVKTTLTRRALSCKDYDGAKKAAKNAEKASD